MTIISLVYLAGLIGFLVLRTLYGSPLISLISALDPLLYAPLVVLLPMALLTRSRGALLAGFAGLALFLSAYGRQFVPAWLRPSVPGGDRLVVMTFNLGAEHSIPETVTTAIADEDADIVAVQELVPATARVLRERLGDRYPYLILNPRYSSNGLLSRYPILNSQWFQTAYNGQTALEATLDVNGAVVEVLAVHPRQPHISWYKRTIPYGLDERGKEPEITGIAQRARSFSRPVLVMGDFNMSDQTSSYAIMSQALRDSFVEAGWGLGLTFPHGLKLGRLPVPGPLVRIDYVFHSDGLRAEHARVTCNGSSDHCYVIAQLVFASP